MAVPALLPRTHTGRRHGSMFLLDWSNRQVNFRQKLVVDFEFSVSRERENIRKEKSHIGAGKVVGFIALKVTLSVKTTLIFIFLKYFDVQRQETFRQLNYVGIRKLFFEIKTHKARTRCCRNQ